MRRIYFSKVTLWSVPFGALVFIAYSGLFILIGEDLKVVWPHQYWLQVLLGTLIAVVVVPPMWRWRYGK